MNSQKEFKVTTKFKEERKMYRETVVVAVQSYAKQNIDQKLTLQDLAAHAGVSIFTLGKIFQKSGKPTPLKWLWNERVKLAKAKLIETRKPIAEVATQCGFNSPQHFSRMFKEVYGMSATEMLKSL